VNYDELEQTFSAKVIEKKEEQPKETKFVQILEHKTAQNLGERSICQEIN
jgi:hypothetical protein